MAHNHGNEYQVKIVHEDGTEELSEWMDTAERVEQAIAAVHGPQGKTFWLRERNVLCTNCSDVEQIVVEFPITDLPNPRYNPHDSRYLVEVGARNWYERIEVVAWTRH